MSLTIHHPNQLTNQNDVSPVQLVHDALNIQIDAFANQTDYQDKLNRLSANTLRTYKNALTQFAAFFMDIRHDAITAELANATLEQKQPLVDALNTDIDLFNEPTHWNYVSSGIVKLWRASLKNEGYAITTINNRLVAIRKFAKIAYEVQAINFALYSRIITVDGYNKNEAENIDDNRQQTRLNDSKKADTNVLSKKQLDALMTVQANHLAGVRDAVLISFMAGLGMRVSETVSIKWTGINFTDNTLTFYRKKVKQNATLPMTQAIHSLLEQWLAMVQAEDIKSEYVVLSIKSNRYTHILQDTPLTTRSASRAVVNIGKSLDIVSLGCHDLRHSFITWLAKQPETTVSDLLLFGGWSDSKMLNTYVHV